MTRSIVSYAVSLSLLSAAPLHAAVTRATAGRTSAAIAVIGPVGSQAIPGAMSMPAKGMGSVAAPSTPGLSAAPSAVGAPAMPVSAILSAAGERVRRSDAMPAADLGFYAPQSAAASAPQTSAQTLRAIASGASAKSGSTSIPNDSVAGQFFDHSAAARSAGGIPVRSIGGTMKRGMVAAPVLMGAAVLAMPQRAEAGLSDPSMGYGLGEGIPLPRERENSAGYTSQDSSPAVNHPAKSLDYLLPSATLIAYGVIAALIVTHARKSRGPRAIGSY